MTDKHEWDQRGAYGEALDELIKKGLDKADYNLLAEVIAEEKLPFTLIAYELSRLRDQAIEVAAEAGDLSLVQHQVAHFRELENRCSELYTNHHLKALSQRNHQRIQHIRAISEKNLLAHYEAHLLWMQQLIAAVLAAKVEDLPEANPHLCDFGRWLHGEGQKILRDVSYRKALELMHVKLHETSCMIAAEMPEKNSRLRLYALIRRVEFLSLDLGSEIALINNMIIVTSYSKDPLTGLLTRRFMEKVLLNQLGIAQATETPFCVAMADLDHFKSVNDRYGHQVGDEVLKVFAKLFTQVLRRSDLVFRFGGEEFLVVLPSTGREQALKCLNEVRQRLSEHVFEAEEGSFQVTCSFGLVEVDPLVDDFFDRERVETLIREADHRLYQAKAAGRNRVI